MVVIVDEVGTEAAAVTSITMRVTSAPLNPNPTPPLVFDRPFIFLLIHESTGAVLFMGTVRDPTGTSTYQPSRAVQFTQQQALSQSGDPVNARDRGTAGDSLNGSDTRSSSSSSSSVADVTISKFALFCVLMLTTLLCL